MQKKRGAIVSYYGIKETTTINDMKVVRPLLSYRKNELLAYCQKNNIPFSLDSSNLNTKYTRNKIRHEIVEKLSDEELNLILHEILKIEQSNNKFKQKEQKEEPLQTKVPQKKTKGLSFFNSVKFSAMFGKRRIIGFLLSAIFASMLICVLSLAQSIANFDAKSMAMDSMTESSVYAVRKDLDTLSGQVHARVITDEDFAKIKQASPDAKLYKLYVDEKDRIRLW